ncbi:acyl-CoA dehydrogenase family protein [Myxococcota bacterium]|nr:acyl-CoA dehydrogenase family protein [Myxococcota bacterium]
MSDPEDFRRETRAWLEDNCPASVRAPVADIKYLYWGGRRAEFLDDDSQVWFERMLERGWTVPDWPVEYGGAGLSQSEQRILQSEMRRLNCRPPLFSYGITMLAPVLLEYGTDEQKSRFLPPIARGEIRWCQGYSEPAAGSDLASLQCRAVLEGGEYLVDGQKIWTSDADISDWIFCLVRTDPSAPKHDGISFLLIDLESGGVSISPIPLISGASPFCQTFFDSVRVPSQQRVGPENGGWSIAKHLLQHERAMLAQAIPGVRPPKRSSLLDVARRSLNTPQGPLPDAGLRDELVQLQMDRICYRATLARNTAAVRAGKGPGSESSMFKLYVSELNQRSEDWRHRAAGTEGLGWDGEGFDPEEIQATRSWLYGKASTILGGTSEIQLNIIAKRVLGLPD